MERQLWDQGCLTWEHALRGIDYFSFGTSPKETVVRVLEKSKVALANGEHQFFAKALGNREAWRAWPHFRSSCCYLDIETDGGKAGNSITTIGIYDGKEFEVFVKGQNMGSFEDRISHFSMIVTFFGLSFDVPMIQKRFKSLQIDQIHFDLCPALRNVGLKGGLKKIEKELGIARGEDTDGLNGYDAILLWRRYEMARDEKALEKLIAYNREDVVNLEFLAQTAYDRLVAATAPHLVPEADRQVQ
jgi:uncharacterized protein YprB with RNaseH-like and TPR domain